MSKVPTIRFAAIQFQPELGSVSTNLRKACELVNEALAARATVIVLPEFFSTAMAFDDSMLTGHRSINGEPAQLLSELAVQGKATVGGSFLAEDTGHVYNSFVLATSDGQLLAHDKDFPSGPIEHAFYAGGEDGEFCKLLRERGVPVSGESIPTRQASNANGVLRLRDSSVGVALCWEMIRHRTVARLRGRVDFVLASSAWPTIDPDVGFPGLTRDQITELNANLVEMVKQAPMQLAQRLGVPVVHANLVGPQRAFKLFNQTVETVTQFCGESAIFDCRGQLLARRAGDEGEGILIADVPIERTAPRASDQTDDFWIPELPPILQELWYAQGATGREYYINVTQPHRISKRTR